MSNSEMISILSKPWASVQDIRKIALCGRDKATYIRCNIESELAKKNKKLPSAKTKYIPMKCLIEYLNIDIKYIYEMAKLENNLKLMEG